MQVGGYAILGASTLRPETLRPQFSLSLPLSILQHVIIVDLPNHKCQASSDNFFGVKPCTVTRGSSCPNQRHLPATNQ